jgi:adenosylcobinamide-GDP ribazoletransferase
MLVCGLAGWPGLLALAAAAITALAFGRWATSRLGGVTGDVYGATCELVETVTLVLVCSHA